MLRREVDDFVCLASPDDFHAVGQFYADFTQTTDAEVRELLSRAALDTPHPATF
jgi:putative phosphoribosyl transferase